MLGIMQIWFHHPVYSSYSSLKLILFIYHAYIRFDILLTNGFCGHSDVGTDDDVCDVRVCVCVCACVHVCTCVYVRACMRVWMCVMCCQGD